MRLTEAQRRALSIVKCEIVYYLPRTGGAESNRGTRIDRRTIIALFDKGLIDHSLTWRGRYVLTEEGERVA